MRHTLLTPLPHTVFAVLVGCLLFVSPCLSQDLQEELPDAQSENLNVFLDCDRCDTEFIRQELTYVNYVRDREVADIHLLITSQRTGSGGTQYKLDFIGLGDFSDNKSVLTFNSGGTNTDDERRRGLAKIIAAGLLPSVSQTPAADRVDLSVRYASEATAAEPQVDRWNNWVFRIGVDGSADGQRTRRSWEAGSNISATRTTEEWKIEFFFNGEYEERSFDIDDETRVFTTRDGSFESLVARSLGPQWSAGLFTSANTSSFSNTNLSMDVTPAIEYNFFPYSESSRRSVRTSYRLSVRSFDYEEETIFGQTAETRLQHTLRLSADAEQTWGEASGSFQYSSYLHDFGKNRLSLFGNVEIRIVRGLSFDIFGRVSRSEDQLFLAAEDPTNEEILLDQRQLASTWDYRVRMGISYRFGSIYNNVVNTRFGSRRR